MMKRRWCRIADGREDDEEDYDDHTGDCQDDDDWFCYCWSILGSLVGKVKVQGN